ncbi:MAG: hypothetical protein EOP51_02620 [Sphingobacteriales bacterium]|nr:MAG: hypothetical protein EOP51_02620 [Sphingobacteriales bacterium]
MKQILLVCVLLITSITTKAQLAINQGACDMQFRTVCFDPTTTPTCIITSYGPWIPLLAGTTVPLPKCVGGAGTAYQVGYASATGCTGQTTVYSGAPTCFAWPPVNAVGTFCPCSVMPYGPNIDYAYTDLYVRP